MGLLVTALLLSHSLVQIPAGLVVDRTGVRRSVALALGIGLLGNGLCIFHYTYEFVLYTRVLAGIGTGLLFVAGIKYATIATIPSRQVLVQSIFGCLINTGSIIPFFVSPALTRIGWWSIFLFTSLFFFFPLVAMAFWRGKPMESLAPRDRESSSPLHKSGAVWTLGLSHAVFFGGMMTIGTWLSSYLLAVTSGDLWLRTTGFIGAIVIGVSAFGRFLGGWITESVPPRSVIWYALAILAPSYAVLGLFQDLSLAVILLAVVAILNSLTFGSVFSLTYQIMPPNAAEAAIGLVNFIASMGALLFPVGFGYLIDITGDFRYPFLFLGALAVTTLGLPYRLRSARS